jgi:hypothetical protein
MRLSRRLAAALAGAGLAAAAFAASPVAGAADPVLVAFAIDTSGSLRPADLARAGDLASGILGALPSDTESVLFTFDDEPRIVVPRTSSPDSVREALLRLRRQGRTTAMNDALYDVTRHLRDSAASRRALVLITDGRDEGSAVDLADGLAVAQQAGIPVFTVGVGRVEERGLRRIAKLTGGEYTALRSAEAATIAGRIAAFEPASSAGPGAAGDRAAPPPRVATTPAPSPAATRGASAARPGSGRIWAWLATALVLLAALTVLFRRGRRAPAVEEEEIDHADRPAPTLLEKMSSTEEYLEKTVTLRERPVLTITRGPGTGQVFDVRNQAATSIGRAKANEVVIDDVSVSSEHCRIRPEDGHFVLHDLKSTNGTFVNERRVTRHVLVEGDILKIGETSLLFKTDLKRT